MQLPKIETSRRGAGPVYRQIADAIREQIETGVLDEGQRLPTIRALAQDLEVNRDTISLAYESLAGVGLLESVVGRGTFVRALRVRAGAQPVRVALASPVERTLAFENARPRFHATRDTVALHSLIPDPAYYPVDDFKRAFNRVLSQSGAELFLYGGPQGHEGLREVLAERFAAVGIARPASDIVLCHGASQGIALALRLFAEAGDSIAVEIPTYANVLGTLAAFGVQAAPVACPNAALDLADLERVLSRPDVKALYTIPTFHNPLGTTTSLAHRRGVLEVAERCGKPIIEDGFEMDLRFSGKAVAPLAALDAQGLVVHLSSFSKSLFPGVRVGSITATGRAVDGLVALKRSTDLSDALPLQAALCEFVSNGGYDRHLVRMRRELRARRDALLTALAQEMPAGTHWTEPDGGYQVWVELPFEIDTRELLADAARAGVLFAPGAQFMPDGRPSRGMRLTFAQANEKEIQRGIRALGRVVEERAGRPSEPARREPVHL